MTLLLRMRKSTQGCPSNQICHYISSFIFTLSLQCNYQHRSAPVMFTIFIFYYQIFHYISFQMKIIPNGYTWMLQLLKIIIITTFRVLFTSPKPILSNNKFSPVGRSTSYFFTLTNLTFLEALLIWLSFFFLKSKVMESIVSAVWWFRYRFQNLPHWYHFSSPLKLLFFLESIFCLSCRKVVHLILKMSISFVSYPAPWWFLITTFCFHFYF